MLRPYSTLAATVAHVPVAFVSKMFPRLLVHLWTPGMFLWGFDSLALKEVQQLFVGNSLLGFALLAFIGLIVTGGYGLIEHPADPLDLPTAASIWRLLLIKMLLEFPQVEIARFCQGMMGAMSPKPTNLLLLNLSDFILTLHSHRVRTDNPKAVAIGKSSTGHWRAAGLKE